MNSQPEDKFEQRIRERLQSWEATPSENAWHRIVSDLPIRSLLWRRMVIVGMLISMIGGGLLVWKWATLAEVDERTVQENKPLPSSASDTLGMPHLPSSGLSFHKGLPKSDRVESFTDTSERNAAAEKPAFSPNAIRGQYTANQPATGRLSNDKASQATLPVATIDRCPIRSQTLLPIVVTQVSSVELPSQPHAFPDASSLNSRWDLWFTANPMLLYQQVTPNPTDAITVTSLNQNSLSKDRLGGQVSTGVRYHLGSRLALELGGYYRYTRNRWTYNYHEALTDSFRVVLVDQTTLEAQPLYREQVGSVRETNHHLGALAGVRYRLSDRWLSNTVGAELQAHRDRNQTVWFAQISYLAEKTLNDHWSLAGGLTFLWNASDHHHQYEYFTLKPYGFGARVGIHYRVSFGKRPTGK